MLLALLLALSAAPAFPAETGEDGRGLLPRAEKGVPRVLPKDVMSRILKGEAVLIVDVRPVEAYRAKRIAGAVSVPLSLVASSLKEFPRDRDIVFY